MCAEDSINRFTGYSADDIQLAQDSEGVSSQVGVVGPQAIAIADGLAFCISDRGPYVVNEGQAVFLGDNISGRFERADRSNIARWIVAYHRGRGEVWCSIANDPTAGGGEVEILYVYNIRLNAWTGPWVAGGSANAEIHCMARFEDANGQEFIMAGFDDGWVRHMDIGVTLNADASDGANGTKFTAIAELAPVYFDIGPGQEKSIYRVVIQADYRDDNVSKDLVRFAADLDAAWTTYAILGTTPAAGQTLGTILQKYRKGVSITGDRFRVQLVLGSDSAVASTVSGIQIFAYDMQRQTV